MKQVIQSARTGKLALTDVPAPAARAGHLLVRTRASLISTGTERLVVGFARKSLAAKAMARPDLVKKVLAKARRDGAGAAMRTAVARLDEPMPLGYSAAGEVAAVGAGLEGRFRVGQRVAMAGAGLANHAELNLVPESLVAAVPDGVADDDACYATLGAIALHAVRNLDIGLGDVVALIGAGLLGQMAAQLLALAGARVLVLDYDGDRLELARRLGAEAVHDLSAAGAETAAVALTGGRGCDAVLIAAATESDEPFATAAAVARDRARVCLLGMTGTRFPYRPFMEKELAIVVSRSYGPGRYDADFEERGVKYPEGYVRWTETGNLAECLRLMAGPPGRRLDVGALTTHRFDFADAEAAYGLVVDGHEARLGVVLTYGDARPQAASLAFPAPAAGDAACVLGLIGAGDFARSVLLPELAKLPGVRLHTIVARRGARAAHAAKSFGFEIAAGDADAVLGAPEINAVVVATRHDSHAELAARALEAGKAVLVEKPLGLSPDQIDGVARARRASAAFFQVGFNRRFAPLALEARRHLKAAAGRRFVVIRVNAGPLAPDNWINHPAEGGGRILSEVCHFVDLARFLVGAPIASVQADAAEAGGNPCDDVGVHLRFTDGSLASIAYTALGDAAASKELIEVYAGGAVVRIDDFRSLGVFRDGRDAVRPARRRQDKGVGAGLRAFVGAVATGAPAIIEAELIETGLATCAVLESLRCGARVEL